MLLGVTIAGIPLALIGLALFLTCLFLAVVLVGELIGAAVSKSQNGDLRSFAIGLCIGLPVLIFAMHAPYLGPPAHVVVVLCGLGLIVERAHAAWTDRRVAA